MDQKDIIQSDIRDEEVTEAADDNNHLNSSKKDADEEAIKKCLNAELPQEPDGKQSGVFLVFDAKAGSTNPLNLQCKESIGVSTSNERDENSSSVQTSQDTTSKTYPHRIMISYSHSWKDLCLGIYRELVNQGFNAWIDECHISGDILQSLAVAIEDASVILVAIDEKYYQSHYCRGEAEYSYELKKHMIPMLMQTDYKPRGWLGFIKGTKLHIDFDKLEFDQAMELLVREIRAAPHPSSEVEKIVPTYTRLTRTMKHARTCPENVKNWDY